MKVLHIFNEIRFSGAEIMYANAAPTFRSLGFDLFAIATGSEIGDFLPRFTEQGILTQHKPIQYGRNLFKIFSYYRDIHNFIKSQSINIVHIHRSDLFLYAIVARFAGTRVIRTQHNAFKNRWFTYPYGILQRALLRIVFGVTYQSIGQSVHKNELVRYWNPTTLINNWLDESQFFPSIDLEEKCRLRKLYGISLESIAVISVGGCSKIKNHHAIIQAVAELKNEFKIEYLHLGCGVTEKEEIDLSNLLGVESLVHFIGNKSNVRDYLACADVYVMPSFFEGLSISVLEAMACKLPLILYNSPGLCDMIEADDCGFLIERSPNQIAEKIREYYSNKELMNTKGLKGRAKVLLHYSISNNVPKIANLYRNHSVSSLGGS